MTKVVGTISQLEISGSITQKGVTGSIVGLGVAGSIVEGGATPPAPPAYCDEAIALFARMDIQASDAQKTLINNLIVSMKSSGVWVKLDVFYNFAQETAQAALLNWKSTSYNATAVNSPTFTALEGFTGNGTTSFIKSNYNPSTAGGNYIQNSAVIGTYIRILGDAGTRAPFGGYLAGADPLVYNVFFIPNRGSGSRYAVINSLSTTVAYDNANIGMHSLIRTGANTNKWIAPDQTYNYTIASAVVTNAEFNFLCINTGVSQIYYYNGQESMGYIGGGLDDDSELRTQFETYMDANGKGVM